MTSRNKVALVDGDFIAYRCAASCEPNKSTRPFREEEYVALGRASDICDRIGDRVAPTQLRIFLGGPRNFRKLLDPSYKANRLLQPKPVHLDAVREYLVRKWGAEVVTESYEVDDRLAILATEDSVICSIDKDLRQIPGAHYNPVKDTFEVVSSEAGAITLYTSMLVGDASDNLRGIDGLGPVKSERLLRGLSPQEAHLKVLGLYQDAGRDFFHSHRLFRLLRTHEEYEEVMNEIAISQGQGPEVATDSEGFVPEDVSVTDTP
jgi:5'-3' exonuclease